MYVTLAGLSVFLLDISDKQHSIHFQVVLLCKADQIVGQWDSRTAGQGGVMLFLLLLLQFFCRASRTDVTSVLDELSQFTFEEIQLIDTFPDSALPDFMLLFGLQNFFKYQHLTKSSPVALLYWTDEMLNNVIRSAVSIYKVDARGYPEYIPDPMSLFEGGRLEGPGLTRLDSRASSYSTFVGKLRKHFELNSPRHLDRLRKSYRFAQEDD